MGENWYAPSSGTQSYIKAEVSFFDMYCTPYLNIQSCLFDGGDCCLPYVDSYDRCGLGTDCSCSWTGRRHKNYKEEFGCRPMSANRYMGDGYCNELLNR